MFHLLLDPSLAKLQRNGAGQNSHDFQIFLNPPILLDSQKSYEAALDNLITMSYSWNNIANEYGNNELRWRKTGNNWQTVTIPDGMYDCTDLNRELQSRTGFVDPTAADPKQIFNLYFDYTTTRAVIGVAAGYELDLSLGDFTKLLGIDKKVLTGATTFKGDRIPDITRSVDWVFLHCDLITLRANDAPSDVLFSFSTANLEVSYPFTKEPLCPKYHPVNKTRIDSIRIRVTDARNNVLDLNDADVALDLRVRQVTQFFTKVYLRKNMNRPGEWMRFFDPQVKRFRVRHKGASLIRDTLMAIGKKLTKAAAPALKKGATHAAEMAAEKAVEKGGRKIRQLLRKRRAPTRKPPSISDSMVKLSQILANQL